MHKILANTLFLGKDIQFLPECHSTNDIAFQLVRDGRAIEGTLVVCDYQKAGKGQRGNTWESGPGLNLTFSLILKPDFLDISEQFYLNMAVSCAIRKVLVEYFPLIKTKWPNDVIVPQRGKLGGILIENSVGKSGWEVAVVGIGLNINQTEFGNSKAVSLKSLTGTDFSKEEILRQLVTQIEQYYLLLKKKKWAFIEQEYQQNLFLFQQAAEYTVGEEKFIGKIIGLKPSGQLVLEASDQDIKVFDFQTIRFPDYSVQF
ncbi:biotin--[acetyl-CoA-carboxylase] ligase [Algoriphagus kandeliae]|uniref:Biotin--[acetyl-CoA-carboxylase] ligase n=1 Tax=Algoriphagus kandeliae TaxID=2562278 RepID=A0A4Y9QTF5_9BACT|nr:biotin--[acetyl-CoA-carboxylase] ligase [Algoriphagus kandeliae]TFV94416.1 biotin--[acetyl-CoA-carboxylase] ligase [Algoriphagus kandeliae]